MTSEEHYPMMRLEEVCYRLEISYMTLNKMIADGRIEATRVGARGVRITESELNRYLKEINAR